MAEHRVRARDVAAGEGPPDRGTADRLVDAVGAWDQRQWFDFEVELGAELAQQVDVAVAVPAEVEVVADDDRPACRDTPRAPARRTTRAISAAWRSSNGDDHDGIDARRGEQLHLLFGAREQPWCRLGPDDRGGMSIERDHDRHGAERVAPVHGRGR